MMPEITIAICTYKRAEIKDTLESISKQKLTDDLSFRVIIADNDIEQTVRKDIEKIAIDLGMNLTYVHAPSQNISIARNACLSNCKTKWLVFLDDDEIACDIWLSELYKTAIKENADVILGPVKSVYLQGTSDWIIKCDFHSTMPVFVNGVIETGYTGNTLLNLASTQIKNRIFDLKLGRSGGEDTDFLSKAFKEGAKIVFSPRAIAYEDVPISRASLSWLSQRKFRVGQSYAGTLINEHDSLIGIGINFLKAFGKFAMCMMMSLIFIMSSSKKYLWFLRGCLHLGVISKLLGKKEIQQY